MTMAFSVAVTIGLTYWTATGITMGADVDGYRSDADYFEPTKRALMSVLITSTIDMFRTSRIR